MAKMRPTLLLFMLGLAASQVVLSAATMKNKKRYRRISKAGFVCKAGGKLAYLESPTLDQCYIYCSVHDDVQDPPFFFGYTRGDQGIPECVCYGSGCVLTSKTKSLSTSVAGTNSLSTSSVEEGIKSGWGAGKRRWLQDSSFGIYRGIVMATDYPTTTPTRSPTQIPSITPSQVPTALPTSIPSSVPSAAPSQVPTQPPSKIPTPSPTVDCYIPDTFGRNLLFCEKSLCDPFLWRQDQIASSQQSFGTAYDVCLFACSRLSLGDMNLTEPTTPERAACRQRCDTDGYNSYLCQVYCAEFPKDPACPRPTCTTHASLEANPEYCDRNFCAAFIPPVNYTLSSLDRDRLQVCERACSAQFLGAVGTEDTLQIRARCQHLCELDGPEQSFLCLKYCQSFPLDPVCPPPGSIDGILSKTGQPTTQQSLTPAPTAPTPVPATELLLREFESRAVSIEQAPYVTLVGLSHLAVGYNLFLGLMPHEQVGPYMRNNIFQFHYDPSNLFIVQQGQKGLYTAYATPLEYLVTSELADCTYDQLLSEELSTTRSEYMSTITQKFAAGLAPVTLETQVKGSGGIPGISQVEAGVSKSTVLSALVGWSSEATIGRSYDSRGMTKSVTETVKRVYYRAGLVTTALTANSFSLLFKKEAIELSSQPYDFTRTIQFISRWGNYVLDAASLGATLYRSTFFETGATTSEVKEIMKKESFTDISAFVALQDKGTSESSKVNINGREVTKETSKVVRIGEFSTVFLEEGGTIGQENSKVEDTCSIGNAIAPQVVEYALRPLWDDEIPLDTFLDANQTDNFRKYMLQATSTQLESGTKCTDDTGASCYGKGGLCLPVPNANGTYGYTCAPKASTLISPAVPVPDAKGRARIITFRLYWDIEYFDDRVYLSYDGSKEFRAVRFDTFKDRKVTCYDNECVDGSGNKVEQTLVDFGLFKSGLDGSGVRLKLSAGFFEDEKWTDLGLFFDYDYGGAENKRLLVASGTIIFNFRIKEVVKWCYEQYKNGVKSGTTKSPFTDPPKLQNVPQNGPCFGLKFDDGDYFVPGWEEDDNK